MARYKDPELQEIPRKSRCSNFLYYTWKIITCIFSHITLMCLVVLYCLLGAWAFARLEVENEKAVKKSISKIRTNVTDFIWKFTRSLIYLDETNWTETVKIRLKKYEDDLLLAMTKDGWDGNEDEDAVQWTFAGALFYSIIVITTIGYGHIAPKTQLGKVVTIFYAILGIPLMLLCLSNIGDILATSFRFLYWKVCCYVCTKKPKKRRHRSGRSSTRIQGRYSTRSRTASFRRSGRTSQRSADSGFGLSEISPVSYSDTDLRYREDSGYASQMQNMRGSSLPRMRPSQTSRYSDSTTIPRRPSPNRFPQVQHPRGGSLDRRRTPKILEQDLTNDKTPVLCNKYIIDQIETNNVVEVEQRRLSQQMPGRRAISVPRPPQNYLEPPNPEEEPHKREVKRRIQSPSSPGIMSPMGFAVNRQRYIEEMDSDADLYDPYYQDVRPRTKPVPIWLCVFLVVSYIFGGAFLFAGWEEWEYLDSAYFCFITLTTIGFGDFVPAKRGSLNAEVSIALCSLYLLFGISLLAMSFNLVQEEVIQKVKKAAKTLGIIKPDESEDDEDD